MFVSNIITYGTKSIGLHPCRSRSLHNRLIGVVFSCLLMVFGAQAVHGQGHEGAIPNLFTEVPGAKDDRGEADTTVVRNRVVGVDLDLLRALREPAGGDLMLNLFKDVQFVATLHSVVTGTDGRVTWFGTLQDFPHGTVALTVGKSIVVGTVRAPGVGFYRIAFLEQNLHAIREVDETRLPPCRGILHPPDRSDRQGSPDGFRRGEKDDGSVIDVLVVYTQAACDASGGVNAIHAEIDLAVAETNQGYNNSSVTPDLNLVGVGQVTYSESGDLSTDLSRLQDDDDGYIDEVHEIRDAVGADVVSFLVSTGDGCGMGYGMYTLSGSFASRAFSVVVLDCATGHYTFGHEIGHNQGCAHDRENADPDDGLYDYSFGHRWVGGSGTEWRSVMAYSPGTRVDHYSNPNVNYDGEPTGVDVGEPNSAHNALTIDNSAFTVANFRQSKVDVVWVDFDHLGSEDGSFDFPFNTAAEGVSALQAGGTLVIKAGTSDETLTIDKAMMVISYQGAATIGIQ